MMEHISYSQINMFLRCGEQYRRRYIENEIIPPTIALIKGKSVHKSIEINGKQKIETHEDLQKQDIIDIAISDYEQNTINQELLLIDDEEKCRGKDIIIGENKDSVVSLASLYADEISPSIQPVSVEEKITIDISGKQIVTIIDCIDNAENIHDFKTASKSKNQNEIDTSLQFTLYALAYREKTGRMPNGLKMDVLVETKKPKYQKLETTRQENSWLTTLRMIAEINKAIDAGIFLPAQPGSWWCSKRFCGYCFSCKFIHNHI